MPRSLVRYVGRTAGQVARYSGGNPYAFAAGKAARIIYEGGKYLYKQNKAAYKYNKMSAKSSGLVTGSAPSSNPKSVTRSVQDTANEGPAGIDSSVINLKRPNISFRAVKAGFGVWQYTQTHSGICTVNAGEQGAFNCFSTNTPTQCVTAVTGAQPAYYQNNTPFVNLNPYRYPSGTFTTTTLTNNVFQDRYIIRNNNIEMHVANMSNVAVTADVYILRCKKNTENDPVVLHNAGFSNERLDTANAAFTHTAAGTTGVAGYLSLAYPGVKVGTNEHFRSYWAVDKVRSLKLAEGASEVIQINIQINKLIKQDTMEDLVSGSAFTLAANQTYHVMIVTKGSLALDTNTSIPTYAQHKVIWTAQVMTRLSAVKGNSERLSFNRGVNTLPLTASLATQKIMESDGDVAAVTYPV